MDDILFADEYSDDNSELIVSEDDSPSPFEYESDRSEANMFDDELVNQFDDMHIDEDLQLSVPDVVELENSHPVYIPPVIPLTNREAVISEIEHIFELQVDALMNDTSMQLTLRSLPLALSPTVSRTRTYGFPGNTTSEAWRFTVVLRLLEMIHECLVKNVTATKRDLYYRDPNLFNSQSIVDRYVDSIARTFGVSRSMLNVTAAAKGLITGAFEWRKSSGAIINGRLEREGHIIHRLEDDDTIDMSPALWILVVEKEASFQSIIESSFWEIIRHEGILLTAKGYPDIATRELLTVLSTPSVINGWKTCPVYGLFDYDPDGVSILSTYKYGSSTLAHQSNINCSSMKWIGVKSSDLAEAITSNATSGLMRLSSRNRRLANGMLNRELFTESGSETLWREEIQRMLMLNVKAEIQFLDSCHKGLESWLARASRDFPEPWKDFQGEEILRGESPICQDVRH